MSDMYGIKRMVLLKFSGCTLNNIRRAGTEQSQRGQVLALIPVGGHSKPPLPFSGMQAFILCLLGVHLVFVTPHLAFSVCDFLEKEYLTLIIILLLGSKLCFVDNTCPENVIRYSGK